MKNHWILLALLVGFCLGKQEQCDDSSLKPEKLVVVGVWKRSFDNSTAQYRISDEDLEVRGYERATSDPATSTVMLARHPQGCVLDACGVRLSALMQNNGAILHTDHKNVRTNDSTMDSIEDEFYCAQKDNYCGADVPVYRLVKHSLNGPHYAYSFDNIGQSLPGYEREFFPLCFAWRQTPSVVLYNSTDNGVCLTLPEANHGRIVYSTDQLNIYSIGTTATLDCSAGYLGTGASNLLCTKDGWYPKEGLGTCERHTQLVVASSPVQADEQSSCPVPASVPNGNVVYSANVAGVVSRTSVPSATRATVLCSIGFVPTSSVTSSKCVDGEWQPALPSCVSLIELKCPILAAPPNSELVFINSTTNPYSLDSVITLKCDRNFYGVGNVTATCTSIGWDQKIGHCEPVGIRRLSPTSLSRQRRQTLSSAACSAIATPSNGYLLYMQSNATVEYSSATTAYLMCNLGYSLSGSVSSLCTNGVWSPTIGQCTSALALGQTTGSCSVISDRVNGTITYSSIGSYPAGTVATLTCNLLNTASGSTTSTCTSGLWSPTLGSCSYSGTTSTSSTSCTNPTVLNGQISYSQGNTYDLTRPYLTTATLTCNSGYTLSGTSQSTCSGGIFTPTLGTCSLGGSSSTSTSATCTNPTVLNGAITYSQGNTWDLTRAYLTTATLTCNTGYTLNGTSQSTCSGGVFTPTLGNCIISGSSSSSSTSATCLNPTVLNGAITYSQGNTWDIIRAYLTTATLTCNSGYTLNGTSQSTCSGGVFTPTLGTCTLGGSSSSSSAACLNPIVMNGAITYSQGNAWDITRPSLTTATLTCNSGYTLNGTSQSTCSGGVYTPTIGTCLLGGSSSSSTSATCTNPTVLNGVITYSQGNTWDITRPYLTTATLTCNSGYTISGTSTSTCSGGVFTPNLGTCALGSSTSTGVQCTAMIAPLGGNVSYSSGGTMGPFASGTTVTGTCNNGGSITGSSTATCSNGMWTPTFLGTCSLIGGVTSGSCSALTVPSGAQATYAPFSLSTTSFQSGTIATVTCTTGGTLLGTSTCTGGVWSSTITNTCSSTGTGTTCTSLTRPIGETVTYDGSASASTSFSSGTVARVTCSNGTQIGQTTCYSGQWTPAISATCSGSSTAVGTQCIGSIVPANSQITYSDGDMVLHSSGTTAALSCLNSATLSGNSQSTCSNGVWTPTLGTCTSSTSTGPCYTPPTAPSGATITYSSGYFAPWTAGSSATMTCPSGQTASGTTLTYCTNAVWSPALGTCGTSSSSGSVAQGCTPLSAFSGTLTNGRMTYTPTVTAVVPVGTVVNVVCYSGYSLSGNSLASCTTSGWSPSTIGSCVQLGTSLTAANQSSCLAMVSPTYGTLSYTVAGLGPFPSGTVVTVQCDTNYVASGVTSATCSDGFWSPSSLATCQRTLQEVVSTSTCPLGIAPVLGATMTYSNGNPVGPYPVATIVTATCLTGYRSTGIMSATCTGTGSWSPATLGTCEPTGNQIGGTTCGRLGDVLSGTLVYSVLGLGPYPSGTSVSVLCNIGSTLSGSASAVCSNGVWNPLPGTCIPAVLHRPPVRKDQEGAADSPSNVLAGDVCPPPVAPAFGEITFSGLSTKGSFSDGTTAALKCNLGYKPSGPSFSTCRKGSFRPIIGKCSNGSEASLPGVCVPLSPTKNSRVVYIQSGSSLDFEDGTTALLYCEEGYAVTGVATVQCQGGQWEPASGFGKCDSI